MKFLVSVWVVGCVGGTKANIISMRETVARNKWNKRYIRKLAKKCPF